MLQHGRITTALAIATTGFALSAGSALAQRAGDVVEPATPPQPTVRADVVQPSVAPQPAPRADVVVASRAPLPTPRADVVVPTRTPQVTRVDLRSPDTRDVANGRGPQFVQTPLVHIVATGSSAHGFDWGDAGIGAGGAIALVLLALGSAMLVTHRRGEHLHSSGPSALAS